MGSQVDSRDEVTVFVTGFGVSIAFRMSYVLLHLPRLTWPRPSGFEC